MRPIAREPLHKVVALWRLLHAVLLGRGEPAGSHGVKLLGTDLLVLRPLVCAVFLICCRWAVGGDVAGVAFGAFAA